MRVFELFSGIGGMHFAFQGSSVEFNIVRALDINTVANRVYSFNFPDVSLMENNVQCLDENIFNDLNIDFITMSPPCQPFTRVGLQKGSNDNRNSAFNHLLQMIPKLSTVKYLLLENVVGFENSSARDDLIDVLLKAGFCYQEFIISPTQFFIPNSRNRYYLLAKRKPLKFCFEESVEISTGFVLNDLPADVTSLINFYKQAGSECYPVKHILEETNDYLVEDNVLEKFSKILDIVTEDSTRTCCFTKAYSHYAKGTGSVFCPFRKINIDSAYKKLEIMEKGCPAYLNTVKQLKMRYFTPVEVSRLMSFPNHLKFPDDVSNRQKYRLLGNSINVHVVSVLIKLILS